MPNPLYSSFYRNCWAITPSDTQPVQGPKTEAGTPSRECRGFYCTVSGNVVARFADDRANSAVTLPVIANTIYPFSLGYVYTATTATIFGLL